MWVNAVAPGPVATPAWVGPVGGRAAPMNGMTIGRMITPEEIAALVLFLASDQAAAITGADYLTDGGMVKAI